MMMQTLAILGAAYRELNARKLFWLAIALSGAVVALFASLGINEQGVTFLTWTFESPVFNSRLLPRENFYKLLFVNVGLEWWIGLLSTLLALVTTAGIIPDLVSPGSVDMMLAKPISRTRLFLTKVGTGLLFTALQVSVFALATIVAIGIRGGVWEWSLLVAVPLSVLFYSYLYCVCALVGVLTRSTVASLIVTLLFWAVVFAVHSAESISTFGRVGTELELQKLEERVAALEKSMPEDASADEDDDAAELERLRERRTAVADASAKWNEAHWWFYTTMTVLPKTAETLSLAERWLVEAAALPRPDEDEPVRGPRRAFVSREVKRGDFARALEEEERSRSVWWVLGTSLIFEAAVLGLATRIFVRRDY